VGVALILGLSACSAQGGTVSAGHTSEAHRTPARTTPTARHTTRPTETASSWPVVDAGVVPGALADSDVGLAHRIATAELTFSGSVLSLSPGHELVTYPSVSLTADATRMLVHLKVPTFRCSGHGAPQRIDRRRCTDREVSYADAAVPAADWSLRPDHVLTERFAVMTYRYGSGVDRDPELPVSATGTRYTFTLTVRPGRRDGTADHGATEWTPRASVSVDGSPEAPLDRGYTNRYSVAPGAA
jgi:hypothetical protein